MTPDLKFAQLKMIISELKHKATEQNAIIFYDGVIINPDQITVNEDGILVTIGDFSDSLYEHTSDWDHGWYDSLEDLSKRIKNHFKLFKEIKYFEY